MQGRGEAVKLELLSLWGTGRSPGLRMGQPEREKAKGTHTWPLPIAERPLPSTWPSTVEGTPAQPWGSRALRSGNQMAGGDKGSFSLTPLSEDTFPAHTFLLCFLLVPSCPPPTLGKLTHLDVALTKSPQRVCVRACVYVCVFGSLDRGGPAASFPVSRLLSFWAKKG